MTQTEDSPQITPEEFASLLREWDGRLERVNDVLSRVIPRREEDFLALGASIYGFSSKARDMSREAGELTELTGGEQISDLVEALRFELDQINEVCGFSRREADVQRLEQIGAIIASLQRRMGSFRKIVRTLRMLGVTTRIESARLGDKGRGFMNLAGQVDSLGQTIVEHWEKIKTHSESLSDQVASALHRTKALVSEQQVVTRQALDRGQQNLATLVALSETSDMASKGLSARADEISAHFGSIVASLQFHDITRQQVEHVTEAVDDMREMTRGEQSQDEARLSSKLQEMACWIADVCTLQISQLGHCRKSFLQAIETLIADLSSIQESVSGMNQDLRQSLGAEDDSSQSALDRIEKSVHHLIDFMHGFAEKSKELAVIMQSVGQTVSQMSTFVANIEEVGSEIELIALNASVQAAHTGEEGLALGVLAGAIQRLSMDARELTDVVAAELNDISENALELQKMADVATDTKMMDKQVARLQEMIASMRALDEQTMTMFGTLQANGEQLRHDVLDQIEAITFHHPVAEEISEVMESFESIADSAMDHTAGDCDPQNRSERLQALLSRYTMDAERMVHLGEEHEPHAAQSADQDVELFGDDVEMFGDDVELFGDEGDTADGQDAENKDKDDLGDNVELF